MKKKGKAISKVQIEPLIKTVRGQKVILDSDLALIYGVRTSALNQAVKRNQNRFPPDFMFKLDPEEAATLKTTEEAMRSQNVTASKRNIRYLPLAFTEHGALMAANILKSPRAIQMSVFVVRAFVKMREVLTAQKDLAKKLADLEKELTDRLDVHEAAIVEVLSQIKYLLNPPDEPEPPKRKIGFHIKEKRAKYS